MLFSLSSQADPRDALKTNPLVSVCLSSLLEQRVAARNVVLPPFHKHDTNQQGGYVSPWRGRGMEFDEVRAYLAGDDIRSIDWRVTARTGKPHTKLYKLEKEHPVFVAVDLHAGMFFGTRCAFKSVIAARLAALIAWAAVYQGDKVGAFVQAGKQTRIVKLGGHERSVLSLCHALCKLGSSHEQEDTSGLTSIMAGLQRIVHAGSLIFLISDFQHLEANAKQHLNGIAKHNTVVACNISDPLEVELPKPDFYPISDGRRTMMLDTNPVALRERYQLAYEQRIQMLKDTFSGTQIGFIEFISGNPLVDTLNDGLRKSIYGQGVL